MNTLKITSKTARFIPKVPFYSNYSSLPVRFYYLDTRRKDENHGGRVNSNLIGVRLAIGSREREPWRKGYQWRLSRARAMDRAARAPLSSIRGSSAHLRPIA